MKKASKIKKNIKNIAGMFLMTVCLAPAGYATFEYLPDLMVDNNSVNTYYYNNRTYYYYTPSSRFINGVPANYNYKYNQKAAGADRYVKVSDTSAKQGYYFDKNNTGYSMVNDGASSYFSKLRNPRNYYMYDEEKEKAGLYGGN